MFLHHTELIREFWEFLIGTIQLLWFNRITRRLDEMHLEHLEAPERFEYALSSFLRSDFRNSAFNHEGLRSKRCSSFRSGVYLALVAILCMTAI